MTNRIDEKPAGQTPLLPSPITEGEIENLVERREKIAAVILWGMEQQTDELVAGLKQRNAPLWQRAMKAAAALDGEVDEVQVPRFSQRSEVLDWILKLGNDRKEADTWLNTNHRSYLNIHVLADALLTLSQQVKSLTEERDEARANQRTGDAACRIVAELVALIPLSQTLAASRNGNSLIGYFKELTARADASKAHCISLRKALAELIPECDDATLDTQRVPKEQARAFRRAVDKARSALSAQEGEGSQLAAFSDMLAALKLVQDGVKKLGISIPEVDAAIAKAEGGAA